MSKFIEINTIDTRDKSVKFKAIVGVDSISHIMEYEGDKLDDYEKYFVIHMNNGKELEISPETYEGIKLLLKRFYNE